MDLLENNPGAGGDGKVKVVRGGGAGRGGAVMDRGRPCAGYGGSWVTGAWGTDVLLSITRSLKN